MKPLLYSLPLIFLCFSAYSQSNTFPATGNVGIGVDNPLSKLAIGGSGDAAHTVTIESHSASNHRVPLKLYRSSVANGHVIQAWSSDRISVNENVARLMADGSLHMGLGGGRLAVGFTTATHTLHVNGSGKWQGNSSSFTEINSNTNGQFMRQYANDGTTLSWLIRGFASGGVQAMFNQGGINVNGTVTAKELNVTVHGWPDYVFSEGYELMDLKDLQRFLEENRHLPGIPSESEIKAHGLNVGEINVKMMEKIEELTLYILHQQRLIDELSGLKEEVAGLKKLVLKMD